ncbi:MAG TPA: energy transducer TonB [Pyrinomonadaceae bacterium]|jgi:TonB family protein
MTGKASAYLLTGLLLSCVCLKPSAAASLQEDFAIVPEAVLRNLAKTSVMPRYPEASRKRGSQGRVVAQVDVDKAGRITEVTVLESPDEEIKSTVVEAIKQWQFGSAYAGEQRKPVRIRGKLTFYFVIEGGDARVRNPRKFS